SAAPDLSSRRGRSRAKLASRWFIVADCPEGRPDGRPWPAFWLARLPHATCCCTAAKAAWFWHSGLPALAPATSPRTVTFPTRTMKKTSFPKHDIRVLLLEGVSRSAIETF